MDEPMMGQVGGWPTIVIGLDNVVWTKEKEVLGVACFSLSLVVLYKMWMDIATCPCCNSTLLYIVQ